MNLMEKKIGPVPVIYIAGGAVAILAVVAYRMKPASDSTPADAPVAEGATLDENGLADGSSPYAGLASNGTVVVQQTPQPTTPEKPERPTTNEEWTRQGAEWLASAKGVSSIAAYAALGKFLRGETRSIQEGQWVEWVTGQIGFPPDPFVEGPVSTTPPPVTMAAPTGLKTTTVGTTFIGVDWNPVPGAAGYQAFLNGKQWGRTVLGSDMTITGLRPGTKYTVTAAAVFDGWKVGPMAPAIGVTTKR